MKPDTSNHRRELRSGAGERTHNQQPHWTHARAHARQAASREMIEQKASGFGRFCVTDMCNYAGGGGVETGKTNRQHTEGLVIIHDISYAFVSCR